MKENKFARLYTAEGKAITGKPWDVYPRPQLKRKSYFSLNGEWEITINGGEKETKPKSYQIGIDTAQGG